MRPIARPRCPDRKCATRSIAIEMSRDGQYAEFTCRMCGFSGKIDRNGDEVVEAANVVAFKPKDAA